eukprot:3926541-Prymnesium_polylepis.2
MLYSQKPTSPMRAESFALPPASPPETPQKSDRLRARLSAGNVKNTPLTDVHVALWHSTVVRGASWKIGGSTVAYATTSAHKTPARRRRVTIVSKTQM